MAGPLVLDHAAIAAACEQYGLKHLVIFGSAVTERFNESTSDVDFLVEFRDDLVNRFDAYFGLKESLKALLGHPVDLVSPLPWRTPTSLPRWERTSTRFMQPEAPGLLWDTRKAARLVAQFVSNRTWHDYQSDAMLRSAIERQPEIVGEALNRLSRLDPDTATLIPDLPRIVPFRNVLIHGYAVIDNELRSPGAVVMSAWLPVAQVQVDKASRLMRSTGS